MNSTQKLIRRYVRILFVSVIVILLLNILLAGITVSSSIFKDKESSPWTMAEQTAMDLRQTGASYSLSDGLAEQLTNQNAFAMLIENDSGTVQWHTDNMPDEIPLRYSISEIASLSRTYLKDYPTFTHAYGDDLIVLAYPKEGYWKLVHNSWDYAFIQNVPLTAFIFLMGNALLILCIYMIVNTKLFRSIEPIINGIKALPESRDIQLEESGALSDIAVSINQTSAILRTQAYELRKKETARVNWIAGISHDIRTPLSIVMGHAGQLETDATLPSEAKQKASAIRRQSERMRNLVSDLNLVSKLEYGMQPLSRCSVNIVSIARRVVADFINTDIEGKYPVEWLTAEAMSACQVDGDSALLERAMTNLIQNCITHNEAGCTIYVAVRQEEKQCVISIEDDGSGMTEEQLMAIQNAKHYLVSDGGIGESPRGLGLLIVRQITSAHYGTNRFQHSVYGGFSASITLPLTLTRRHTIY